MDEQRKRVYSFRQSLLDGAPPKDTILEMIDTQISDAANRFLADDYGTASFAEWVAQRLGVEVTARDFKGATFEDAEEIVRVQGRAAARRHHPRGHGGEPALRRRARRSGPGRRWRTGPTPGSSSTSRRRTSRSSPARTATSSSSAATTSRSSSTRRPPTSIEKLDLTPAKRVPRARLGPPVAGGLGPPQVRRWRSTRDLGRARPGRDRPPAPEPSRASTTPARRPSSPSGSR